MSSFRLSLFRFRCFFWDPFFLPRSLPVAVCDFFRALAFAVQRDADV